jgi:tetratricopeptide (TPR) repeat protein
MKPLEIESSSDYQEAAESYLSLMANHSLAPTDTIGEPESERRVSWWIRDGLVAIAGGLAVGFAIYQFFASTPAETPRASVEGTGQTAAPRPEPSPSPAADNDADLARAVSAGEVEDTPEENDEPAVGEGARVASTGALRTPAASDQRMARFRRLIARGWKFYQAQNFAAASNVFGRATREEPRKIDGYYGLALALFEQGQDDAACRVLERGARAIGRKSELWLLGGSIYQVLGDEAKAREAYQRYLAANPKGAYAKDIRALLSLETLPKLRPEDLPQMEEGSGQ